MPALNLSAWLGIGLIAACCAWTIDHSMASTKYARLEASIATKRSEVLEGALLTQNRLNTTVADLTQKLSNAEAKYVQFENERDTAIAAGIKRVYVHANCPAMSEASGAAAGANAVAAELDPAYRSTLSELRRRDREKDAVIIGLQDYVRACRGEK